MSQNMAESVEEIIEEEIVEEEPKGPPSLRDTIEAAITDDAATDAVIAEGEETAPEKQVSSKPESEDVPEPLGAPHSWNKEDAEHWATLPRPLQEVVLRRESERDRGTQQRIEEATRLQRRYQELDQVLEPHQTTLGLEGKTPAQLVREHLAAEELLRTNPVAGIQWFCHHYGVTPQQLIDGARNQPQVDPHVQSLLQEVAQLKGYLSNQQQQAQLDHARSLKDEIRGFAEEKDSEGNLLRPYWENVKEKMPRMINLAKADNPQGSPRTWLEQAYRDAVRLDEDIFKREQQAQLERQKQVNNAKAQEARRASSGIVGAPPGGDKVSPPKDLRSVIEAAVDGRL